MNSAPKACLITGPDGRRPADKWHSPNGSTTTKTLACPIHRRHFLAQTALAIAACSLPRRLYAAAESPVNGFRSAAATAKIITHKLRGNVSTLEGSGGNIAVLTGPDGKLLVDDAERTARYDRAEALYLARRARLVDPYSQAAESVSFRSGFEKSARKQRFRPCPQGRRHGLCTNTR